MNLFNRILAIAIAAAAAAFAVCVFLVAVNWITPAQLGALAWVPNLFAWQTRATAVAIGAAIAFLAAIALLYAEFVFQRDRSSHMLIKHDELGSVIVARHGIEDLVTREAGRVRGVQEAHSSINEGKTGLRIAERLTVAPDANIPALSREVQERIKSAVERYIGRPVAEVSIDAHPIRQAR
jgi:lysylphosphatidylglycerol synthetase-like protein (DUF2156 family)